MDSLSSFSEPESRFKEKKPLQSCLEILFSTVHHISRSHQIKIIEVPSHLIYQSFQHQKSAKWMDSCSWHNCDLLISFFFNQCGEHVASTVLLLPLSHNGVICPKEKEVIWPHISGGLKILFLRNPRIGLISRRVTSDTPMDREIESLNVEKRSVEKKPLFSFHFVCRDFPLLRPGS